MAVITGEEITDVAIKRWSTAHSPRVAELMTTLVRYVHDYTREVRLTEEEWSTALDWVTAAGAMVVADGRRELAMMSEVIGLSTLVLDLNADRAPQATPPTPPGPYHVTDSPQLPYGFDMSRGAVPGTPLYVTGRVTDIAGTPLPGVVITAWEADAEGKYHEEYLRGKYTTRDDGTYCLRTVPPAAYSMPMDGPVGELMAKTDMNTFRPAHIHVMIDEPGYQKIDTELFPADDKYLDNDAAFAARKVLAVPFVEQPAGATPDCGSIETPYLRADFDFVLQNR